MTPRTGLGQIVLDLQELVRIQMETGARLLLVSDKQAADALEIRRAAYQDVLDLIEGTKTLEEITSESQTAITTHVPPLPKE